MAEKALGMIEVKGFLGAVSVADAALKAANVTLANADIIRGGYTTIELTGDVAAVQAAVDAGVKLGETLNCLLSSHVIARLDTQAEKLIAQPEIILAEEVEVVEETVIDGTLVVTDEMVELAVPADTLSENELRKMELKELRAYALSRKLTNLTENEIQIATKKRLVKAILKEK